MLPFAGGCSWPSRAEAAPNFVVRKPPFAGIPRPTLRTQGDRPLVAGTEYPSVRSKLTLAGKASYSSVSSLAWPRTRSHGQELPVAILQWKSGHACEADARLRLTRLKVLLRRTPSSEAEAGGRDDQGSA